MFTRGNAKHPCTRLTSIRGFAVRPIRPYGCGCIRIQPPPLYTDSFPNYEESTQLYLETLGVYVGPEMKPPVPVQQTVNEQPNNSPNLAGLVVFLVGILVLAIWGFTIIGGEAGSGMSPVYLIPFLFIVGGPIFIVLLVFSTMLTYVTNTNKEIPNVQTTSIQGLSIEEKWGLRVKARRQAMSQERPPSTAGKWGLRMISPVFIVIGFWIPGAVSSVGNESIAATLGVISILSGVLLFLVTLRTKIEEIESE